MEQQEYESPSVELEPEDEKSAFDRFGAVFTSPEEAFEGIATSRRRKSIIAWGLLIAGLVSAFAVIMTTLTPDLYDAGIEKRREALERAHESGKMNDEMYESQIEGIEMMGPTATAIMGGVSAAIVTPIFMLILALIGLVIAKVLERDNKQGVTFASMLATLLIANMISFVGGILTVILQVVLKSADVDLSPGAFIDTDSYVLGFLLSTLNPFTLWWFFAIGTGTAMLSGTTRGKAIGAWAGVWVIGGSILAGIGQLLGGVFGF